MKARSGLGFFAFLALSLAAHAGVLWISPEGGAEAQGAGGSDTVTLVGSPASYAALVEMWHTPPAIADTPELAEAFPSAERSNLSPEMAVSRQSSQGLPQPEIETAPRSPAERPAAVSIGLLQSIPGIAGPELDTSPRLAIAPDLPRASEPRGSPSLVQPETAPPPAPQPDRSVHFEGSSARATSQSQRPIARPDDLAPPPTPPLQPAAPTPQAPRASQPPSDAAPERTAAGQGSGASQGTESATAPQPGLSAAQVQSLRAQWGGQIQARIGRSRPAISGTGRAVVQLSVAPNGRLLGLGILQSSGDAAIDQAALSAVRRAGRFPRAPAGLSEASYTFSVPMTFR